MDKYNNYVKSIKYIDQYCIKILQYLYRYAVQKKKKINK
jgi:hypothetical protein